MFEKTRWKSALDGARPAGRVPALLLFVLLALMLALGLLLRRGAARGPPAKQHSQHAGDGLVPRAPNPWFFAERAFPTGHIPPELVQRARQEAAILREEARAAAERAGGRTATWIPRGPTNVGGRITDLAVDPRDASRVYAAAAEGGILRTDDAGQHWLPLFDQGPALAMGAVALDPANPDIVYAGGGEVNPGGGSVAYGGAGLFRSPDRGANWASLGLEEVGAIGRIRVDPTNTQRLFVAAMGQLWETDAAPWRLSQREWRRHLGAGALRGRRHGLRGPHPAAGPAGRAARRHVAAPAPARGLRLRRAALRGLSQHEWRRHLDAAVGHGWSACGREQRRAHRARSVCGRPGCDVRGLRRPHRVLHGALAQHERRRHLDADERRRPRGRLCQLRLVVRQRARAPRQPADDLGARSGLLSQHERRRLLERGVRRHARRSPRAGLRARREPGHLQRQRRRCVSQHERRLGLDAAPRPAGDAGLPARPRRQQLEHAAARRAGQRHQSQHERRGGRLREHLRRRRLRPAGAPDELACASGPSTSTAG